MKIPQAWRRLLFSGLGIILLVVLFYAEENWRGKRDWENCRHELEAKGQTLKWNAYLPPPVPDAQNFYKAPKMADWFVKSRASNAVNILARRLAYTNTGSMVLAEVVLARTTNNLAPTAGNPDAVLRYSAIGPAVFLPSTDDSTNLTPGTLIPQIRFVDVPLTMGIENLARVANIHYLLDPNIGYNLPDKEGLIKPEPVVTVSWDNITALQALQALLNQNDLEFQAGAGSNLARITTKQSGSPQLYISPEADEEVAKLLQNVVGCNLVGSQAIALLTNSPATIKPARIIIQSETPLDDKEIIALFTRVYPNQAARQGSPRIHAEPLGKNSFRIIVDAVKAADYLAWSDQFKPEFDILRAALKRPYARLDGDYSQPFFVPIPDFVATRAVAQMLATRAQCDLLQGQPDQALQELKLLHDFRQVLEARPSGKLMTVVTAMINVAVAGLYTDTIADGLRLHVWQGPQLVEIQNQLKEINLPPFLIEALKAEPAGICHWGETFWIDKSSAFTCEIIHSRVPKGWAYQNLVTVARLSSMGIAGYATTNGCVSPRLCDAAARDIDNYLKHDSLWGKLTIQFKILAAVAIPNFVKAKQTTAYHQTMVNEAQIACALERYHLVHGDYPATLDALPPEFIDKIPHDIIGGEALKYRRLDDDRFRLYSIGWNELDENGSVISDNGFKYDQGDWVWAGR